MSGDGGYQTSPYPGNPRIRDEDDEGDDIPDYCKGSETDDGAELTWQRVADPVAILRSWFVDRVAHHPRQLDTEQMQFLFRDLLDSMTGLSHGEQQRVILCEDSLYTTTTSDSLDTKLCVTRLKQTVHALLPMNHDQRLHKISHLVSIALARLEPRLKHIADNIDKKIRDTLGRELTEAGADQLKSMHRLSCVQGLVIMRRIEVVVRNLTQPKTSPFGGGPLTPQKRAEIEKNREYRREKDALERREKREKHARYSKERAYETGEVRPRENGVRYVGQWAMFGK